MTNPTEWGAEAVETPESWGAEPAPDPAAAESADIPSAFWDRLRRGAIVDDHMARANALANRAAAFNAGAAEGFGPEPLGLSDESRRQLIDLGIMHDYTANRAGALSIGGLGDASIEATTRALDWLMRSMNAGIHGSAGLFGEMVNELTGSEQEGMKAKKEATNMANMLLIESGMGRFHRPSVGPDQIVRMQPIGGLPTAADFRTAADAMGAAGSLKTEENLRQLWQERGIHPAEAVADAERDAFLRADLTHPDPNPPDRSGIAPVTSTPMPAGIPRSELAKTGEAHIDALLDSAPVRQALDNPVIDRSRDVPAGVGRLPESMTVDGATFDPAEPLAVRATVERAAAQALTQPIWFHGTPHEFEVFDLKRVEETGESDISIAFSSNRDLAQSYAEGGGIDTIPRGPGRIIEARANFKNPLIIRKEGWGRRGQQASDIERAKAAGHDGIIYEYSEPSHLNNGTMIPGGLREALAWEPGTIVDSRTGKSLLGEFNPGEQPSGMETEAAARVAQEYAAKAESAWYTAHGIDQAKAQDALKSFVEPREAAEVPAEDRAQAKEILTKAEEAGELQPPPAGADVGAAVTPPGALPTPAQQPLPPPGSLAGALQTIRDKLFSIVRDIQMKTSPMVTGSQSAMALAKDFANTMRRNRWEWNRIDQWVVNNPDLKAVRDRLGETAAEQRERMWNAADEESVLQQSGHANPHMGIATLEPEEQAIVADLNARSQAAWQQAISLGMVEGQGLPSYTPRMLLNLAEGGEPHGLPLDPLGRNLRVRTGQMLHREHMEAADTEAAAKQLVYNRRIAAGDTPAEAQAAADKVSIARDIRSLPLATAKLEDAIAGRMLIDAIEAAGKNTGSTTVSYGAKPGPSWFTVDHPAFYRWQPRFEAGTPKLDANGDIIFDRVPIYVHGDFEGPLRAVLTKPSGAIYSAMMSLKGKTMGLIMNSPLIHNAVEWGRAMPAMPGKVLTFRVYFQGNRAKADPAIMREAIDGGLVPIGHRFFGQDITSIMEEPNLQPGRSFTAQVAGFVPGLFDQAAGNAVKAAIDKAGDFWHNTILWDRVGDLQMGLYVNFRDGLLQKGVDRLTATRVAAHWANRYAGALPAEAMSDGARKISNMLLFSRSFTMGNLGAMKDMLTGLPRDVMAQIERDTGGLNPTAAQLARGMARRKAISIVALDIGLMYVGNSLLQSGINVLRGDKTLDKEMSDYAQRFHDALQETGEHPASLLFPIPVVSAAMNFAGHVSSTYENEPGKQDRIRIGFSDDGKAIYMRNPVGKIGEEFTGYLTGPLDMIKRKLGTIARPGWEIMANDKGFGRKVYDPDAKLPADQMRNAWEIAKVIAGSQLPEGQINALSELVKGEGDAKVAAAGAFGPLAGVTFSQGAPGGPAVGELYHAKAMHDYKVQLALPDLRKQIQRGDIDGARAAMTELGISPALQRYYIKTTQNPALRLSPRALRDFQRYAPAADRQRMEELRQ